MATWTALRLTLPIAENAYAPLRRDALRSARRSVSTAVAVCNFGSQRLGARRCAGPTVVWAIRLGHGTDPVQTWKGANSPS
jgi:hypothetical protein